MLRLLILQDVQNLFKSSAALPAEQQERVDMQLQSLASSMKGVDLDKKSVKKIRQFLSRVLDEEHLEAHIASLQNICNRIDTITNRVYPIQHPDENDDLLKSSLKGLILQQVFGGAHSEQTLQYIEDFTDLICLQSKQIKKDIKEGRNAKPLSPRDAAEIRFNLFCDNLEGFLKSVERNEGVFKLDISCLASKIECQCPECTGVAISEKQHKVRKQKKAVSKPASIKPKPPSVEDALAASEALACDADAVISCLEADIASEENMMKQLVEDLNAISKERALDLEIARSMNKDLADKIPTLKAAENLLGEQILSSIYGKYQGEIDAVPDIPAPEAFRAVDLAAAEDRVRKKIKNYPEILESKVKSLDLNFNVEPSVTLKLEDRRVRILDLAETLAPLMAKNDYRTGVLSDLQRLGDQFESFVKEHDEQTQLIDSVLHVAGLDEDAPETAQLAQG